MISDILPLFFYTMAYIGILSMISWLLLCCLYHIKNLKIFKKSPNVVLKDFPLVSNFPLVSIIVPAYNEEGIIADKIKSLLEVDYPRLDIIIVNDGSTDKTSEIAKSFEGVYEYFQEQLKIITIKVIEKQNGGKSSALNTGIKACKGEIMVINDADVIIEPKSIYAFVKHFIRNNSCVAVSGRTRIPRLNWITNCVFHEVNIAQHIRRPGLIVLDSIHLAIGPLSAFRKSAIEKVGGYREDVLAEDYELTLRLIKKGWRVEFELDAICRPMRAVRSMTGIIKQRRRWYKGILDTIVIHKDMMFNKKYRWIGCYFMPMSILKIIMMFIYLIPSLILISIIIRELGILSYSMISGIPIFIKSSHPLWILISIWMFLMIMIPLIAIILGDIRNISSILYLPLSFTIYKMLLVSAWILAIYDIFTKKGYKWHRGI